MSVAEKLTIIAENQKKVYDAGFAAGKAQGGGGGGTYGENEIIFYDYDGTIVYSCTIEEANNLTELPTPPEHEGLIFQEWNYTLEEVNSTTHILDIGAMYDTYEIRTDIIDGVETSYVVHPVRLYMDLPDDGINIETNFGVGYFANYGADGNKANKAMIDWGDGSPYSVSSADTVDYYGNYITNHTYESAGKYVIKIFAHPDNLQLVDGEYVPKGRLFSISNVTNALLNRTTDRLYCKGMEFGSICNGFVNGGKPGASHTVKFITFTSKARLCSSSLYSLNYFAGVSHISVPKGNTIISYGGFGNNMVKSISLPNTITSCAAYAFPPSLQRLVIPDSVTSLTAPFINSAPASGNYRTLYLSNQLSSYPANMCQGQVLDNLYMGSNVSSFGSSCFRESGLRKFVFENDVTGTLSQIFYGCTCLNEVIFKGNIESISSNCFYNCSSLVHVEFVPSTVKNSISFAQSSALSKASIQSIIDGLVDLTDGTAQTLTLHADVKAKLTESQIAAITSKNWTLA